MTHRATGIAIAALTLSLPLASVAASFEFDRNANGTIDIRFSGDQSTRPIVQFDNDEDGKYDFGFQGGCNGQSDYCAMWIDKNSDGKTQKSEIRMLPQVLSWATFPTVYGLTSESDGNGGITHFMDYTDDAVIAHEIGRDLDGDGDLERDILRGAIGEGASDALALVDTDNNGFFDLLGFMAGGGELMTETATFRKPQEKQLPVLDMLP